MTELEQMGSMPKVLVILNDDRAWTDATGGISYVTATEAQELLGISYRRLDHYCRAYRQHIPMVRGSRGSGSARRIGREGLRALFILSRLADARQLTSEASRLGAREVIRQLRQICGEIELALPKVNVK